MIRRAGAAAWQWAHGHPVRATVAIAVGVRVVLVLAIAAVTDEVVPDETRYVALAGAVADGRGADGWSPGYGQDLYDSVWLFIAPLARLFDVVGTGRVVGQLWAAVWGAVAAGLSVVLARELTDDRRAHLAAGLAVALFPSQVFWSSIVLRESMVWSALVLLAIAGARANRATGRRLVAYGGLVFGVLLGLCFLRDQVAVVGAWSVMLAALLAPGPRRLVRAVVIVAAAVLAPMLAGLGPAGAGFSTEVSSNLSGTRAVLGIDANSSIETSSAVLDTDGRPVRCRNGARSGRPGAESIASTRVSVVDTPDGPVRTICGAGGVAIAIDDGLGATLRDLPSAVASVLFRPYPWEGGSGWMRLAAIEGAAWYALYICAAVGLVRARRRLGAVAFPAIATAAIVATSAISQGNLGTAYRHRGELVWALAALAAMVVARAAHPTGDETPGMVRVGR